MKTSKTSAMLFAFGLLMVVAAAFHMDGPKPAQANNLLQGEAYTDYMVMTDTRSDIFPKKIKAAMGQGWRPIGGVGIQPAHTGHNGEKFSRIYYQAMGK